jgi:magnesium-transporting ATPase (P-type)
VTPEEKFRIVKSLKDAGEIVAVTGDGVNDAPSLKKANIGIAMGISGTDLARENSDMVLVDDSFASIVKGIESGRVIFENIRRFIIYVFAHNWAELIPYLLYVLLGIPLPLLVMQVLAIDLFIDVIPALAISQEPPEPGIMNESPRSTQEHLFDAKSLLRSFYVGIIIAIGAMWGCFNAWISGGWQFGMLIDASNPIYFRGTAMTFAGIVMGQAGNLFSCRTNKSSIFRVSIWRNKWILLGIFAQLVILLIFIYLPWLQPVFGTTNLSAGDWGFLLCITGLVIGAEELRKALARKYRK